MTIKKSTKPGYNRNTLAYSVLLFSTFAITGLAIFSVVRSPDEAKDIFNAVLPVFSPWVGTILAFYFGRENFESANEQVRVLVEKLGPEERTKSPVRTIMRPVDQITLFRINENISENNISLTKIQEKFVGSVSRLPIVDKDNKPKYMIHQSRVDQFLLSTENNDPTLENFLSTLQSRGLNFGLNSGFVIVPEITEISISKQKMESFAGCQDIFITKKGTPDEPLIGWISNVRLMKYIFDAA